MTAVKSRKAAATKPKGASAAQPAPPQTPADPASFSVDQIDRYRAKLCHAQAALTMLSIAFGGDGLENPKAAAGLMGSMQFAQRTLASLHEEVMEMDRCLDDFYWGVFQAYSLVSLLDELEWDDGYTWRCGENLIVEMASAASSCIELALGALKGMEASR